MRRSILIIDLGSQYTQLIARKVRELGIFTEIVPYSTSFEEVENKNPYGIILSEGPGSSRKSPI